VTTTLLLFFRPCSPGCRCIDAPTQRRAWNCCAATGALESRHVSNSWP
jgi:hypothetical protein